MSRNAAMLPSTSGPTNNVPLMRDDFSENLKRALAARVGNVCSNPTCSSHTSGPHVDPAKTVNIGIAAHIAAAAPGGPRFDHHQVPADRSGASNAIWLCSNCARLVDSDPARFPTSLLIEWKATAEEAAFRRLGRPVEDSASPRIQDKWCTLEYIEQAGIGPALRDAGYKLYWARAEDLSRLIDLEDWEEVVWEDPKGLLWRFKVKDPIVEYLILIKKANTPGLVRG